MQGLCYTNVVVATPSRGTLWYCKSWCVSGATGQSNGKIWDSYYHEMRKIK